MALTAVLNQQPTNQTIASRPHMFSPLTVPPLAFSSITRFQAITSQRQFSQPMKVFCTRKEIPFTLGLAADSTLPNKYCVTHRQLESKHKNTVLF